MKRLATLIAAAAVALAPAAAVEAKPPHAPKGAAKTTKAKAKGASAQRQCREERDAIGRPAFAAKYGKARTKGSAKARAKLARAAFGRCVAQAGKRIRAERRAALEDEDDEELEDEDEKPEPDDGDAIVDKDGDDGDADREDPDVGLAGDPDLE